MFTISQPKRLAFTEADVASHYGVSGPITVKEMRPFAISPEEKYIAGTCVFVKPPSTTEQVRGFILKRAQGSTSADPSWDLQPDFTLPTGWAGMSVRGVNDRGDIAGFFFFPGENPATQFHPWAKLDGKPPVALVTSGPNPTPFGGVWAIDQDRNIGGEFTSPTGAKAFMAKLKPDGNIDPLTFSEFPAQRIRSFNTNSDLLWERKIGGVRQFFLRPGPSGDEIPISQTPALNNLGANANVVNHSDQIVGWLVSANFRGFLGQVVNGVFDGEIWTHPEATIETMLFGFSNHGTVVGTFDKSKMFFVHAE
jgi:hypothetical protein